VFESVGSEQSSDASRTVHTHIGFWPIPPSLSMTAPSDGTSGYLLHRSPSVTYQVGCTQSSVICGCPLISVHKDIRNTTKYNTLFCRFDKKNMPLRGIYSGWWRKEDIVPAYEQYCHCEERRNRYSWHHSWVCGIYRYCFRTASTF